VTCWLDEHLAVLTDVIFRVCSAQAGEYLLCKRFLFVDCKLNVVCISKNPKQTHAALCKFKFNKSFTDCIFLSPCCRCQADSDPSWFLLDIEMLSGTPIISSSFWWISHFIFVPNTIIFQGQIWPGQQSSNRIALFQTNMNWLPNIDQQCEGSGEHISLILTTTIVFTPRPFNVIFNRPRKLYAPVGFRSL
jgi:hypothetical protein